MQHRKQQLFQELHKDRRGACGSVFETRLQVVANSRTLPKQIHSWHPESCTRRRNIGDPKTAAKIV